MYGPDPASGDRATIGGIVGNNSTGTHSILYGMTSDHVQWLDVILASGEKVRLGNQQYGTNSTTVQRLREFISTLYRQYGSEIANNYPNTWRTVAGYGLNRLNIDDIDLAQLIIGAEGTLGSIVAAGLKLVSRPQKTRLAIVHFADLMQALESVPPMLETSPSAIELMDKMLLDRTREQPEFAKRLSFVEGDPQALLVVEYYGTSDNELTASIDRLKTRLKSIGHRNTIVTVDDQTQQANVWKIRKAGLGLLASQRSPWKTVAVIEDVTVPVEHLANYISDIKALINSEKAEMAVYAHASAGCLHVRPLLDLKSFEGMRQYRAIANGAVELVQKYNGTMSGEHGEGILRGEFSPLIFGAELTTAFHKVKQAFDPDNIMNPNKMIDVPPMDSTELMRYGDDYQLPLELKTTRFNWKDDLGFSGAIEMCNGAGVCRKEDSGTMCPSFMATREEKESTRGRANILRLAMSGTLGLDNLQDIAVKDVLDLCLSCKACKAECPSAVDMARIKAEFMASYQDEQGIPLRSQLFANVHRLNKLASFAPQLANWGQSLPGIAAAIKYAFGIASDRDLPSLASQTFQQWWKKQEHLTATTKTGKPIPILLIDTFTEYYEPALGQALHYLLTQMDLPMRVLPLPQEGCCGRPAMSKGMLDQAKKLATTNVQYLMRILALEPDARFMLLEPSCTSALIDEYPTLVDEEWQAWAVQVSEKTMSIESWLHELQNEGHFDTLPWDHNAREIILHGHCHQKALWGTSDLYRILSGIPAATVHELDAGCCGMAGSFGYEAEHYATSMAIAEQRLYPAIRNNPDAIIVAQGTSCREQISHIQGNAMHPVILLARACGWQE